MGQHIKQSDFDSQLNFFCIQLEQMHTMAMQQQTVIEWLSRTITSQTQVGEGNSELQAQVASAQIPPSPQGSSEPRWSAQSFEAVDGARSSLSTQTSNTGKESQIHKRKGAELEEAQLSFLELRNVGTCELTEHTDIPHKILGYSGNGEPRRPTSTNTWVEERGSSEAFRVYEDVLCECTETESFPEPTDTDPCNVSHLAKRNGSNDAFLAHKDVLRGVAHELRRLQDSLQVVGKYRIQTDEDELLD